MTRRTVTVENLTPTQAPAGSVRAEPGESGEDLFERVCGEISVRCKRSPPKRTRTADFWLYFADGTEVLAEVKQFVPNAEEREHQARLDRNEIASIVCARAKTRPDPSRFATCSRPAPSPGRERRTLEARRPR
jgi:hypothetical protein